MAGARDAAAKGAGGAEPRKRPRVTSASSSTDYPASDEPVRAPPRRRRGGAGERPRALLRPRLRLRDHADLAPAAARPELARGLALGARADGRLVGLELHDVGHERARPRLERRPPAADRD